jgi:hypothetical protein
MSNGPYRTVDTFRLPEIGTVELLQRMAGYNTYHLRRSGDDMHTLKITKHEANALIHGGTDATQIVRRYFK